VQGAIDGSPQEQGDMKMALGAGLAAMAFLAGSVAHAQKMPKSVMVSMETSDARDAGRILLIGGKNGIQFEVKLQNLVPGEHGIHVHQNPSCDAPSFKTAGGHFNPDGKEHGYDNPKGHHAGDIPLNLHVGDDGMVKQTFFVKGLTLDPKAANSVFANGGTSIIIHQGPDDMKTDPSGNSGAREACGIVSPAHASLGVMSFDSTASHVGASNE
jgi:Cu-Zn family superoxide dismutase